MLCTSRLCTGITKPLEIIVHVIFYISAPVSFFMFPCSKYSLINMRQLQILIISAKTWHQIVLAWSDHKIFLQIKTKQFYDQVMQELRKNREIQLNKQTIWWQVLADMIKIWICLIFIKLYITKNQKGPRTI